MSSPFDFDPARTVPFSLFRYDGLVLRICGDNKPYAVNLYCTADEDGEQVERVYMARFNARGGFSTLRLPFSNFIARVPGDPPLDITQMHSLSISYDSRRLSRTMESTMQSEADSNKTRLEVRDSAACVPSSRGCAMEVQPCDDVSTFRSGGGPWAGFKLHRRRVLRRRIETPNSKVLSGLIARGVGRRVRTRLVERVMNGLIFALLREHSRRQVRYIKLMPRGDEPDFLLVSCTGTRDSELSEADTEKLLMYKGRGESALRNSGLGCGPHPSVHLSRTHRGSRLAARVRRSTVTP